MTLHHIELTSGLVADAYMEGANGRRSLPEEIGQPRFIVDAVGPNGSRLSVTVCETYDAARVEAEQARAEFGIAEPVHDLVVGG